MTIDNFGGNVRFPDPFFVTELRFTCYAVLSLFQSSRQVSHYSIMTPNTGVMSAVKSLEHVIERFWCITSRSATPVVYSFPRRTGLRGHCINPKFTGKDKVPP